MKCFKMCLSRSRFYFVCVRAGAALFGPKEGMGQRRLG